MPNDDSHFELSDLVANPDVLKELASQHDDAQRDFDVANAALDASGVRIRGYADSIAQNRANLLKDAAQGTPYVFCYLQIGYNNQDPTHPAAGSAEAFPPFVKAAFPLGGEGVRVTWSGNAIKFSTEEVTPMHIKLPDGRLLPDVRLEVTAATDPKGLVAQVRDVFFSFAGMYKNLKRLERDAYEKMNQIYEYTGTDPLFAGRPKTA